MKAVKHLLLAGVVLFGAQIGRTEEFPWFDAGVKDYASWTRGVDDWWIPGVGTWQGVAGVTLQGEEGARWLNLFADATCHTFELSLPKPVEVQPVVSTTIVMPPMYQMPTIDSAFKGGLIALVEADGTTNYYGCVAAARGSTNVWHRLSGSKPKGSVPVAISIAYRSNNGANEVRYQVDGVSLTDQGTEWCRVVFPAGPATVQTVGFQGGGEIRSLTGTTTESPGNDIPLTIPSLEKMTVAAVAVGGRCIQPQADGTYWVPSGSLVAVSFIPAEGYFLSSSAMTFHAGSGAMTLPDDGRPVVHAIADFIHVNEIMASNKTGLKTSNGIKGLDWIELANTSDSALDVAGWLLSDKSPKKDKWVTIEGSALIPAHGFLVVFLDTEETDWDTRDAHAPLGLAADGETIALATPEKTVVDVIDFDFQLDDYSTGRLPSEDALAVFSIPTPGAANTTASRHLPTPLVKFSEPHGWKTSSFTLALSCESATNAAIYYTTDGKSPTTASTRYTVPFTVSRTTVVRAAVIDAQSVLQRDTSASYLFASDVVTQSGTPAGFPASNSVNGQKMVYGMRSSILNNDGARLYHGFTNSTLTVSLVIDPQNLFNASTGIYVNASHEGRTWERHTLIEQINPRDPDDEFSTACGLRIRGAASRGSGYPKHSFRIFFRDVYGARKLAFPLFGAEGPDEIDKIDLRTDQNQSYANGDKFETMVHDVFSRDSQRAMGHPGHRTRYFHLFLNGIYWGLYMYEERCSQEYAASVNGGKASHYDVIRTSQPGYITGVVEGETTATSEFLRIVNSEGFGAAYPANYNRVRGLNADGSRNPDYPVYLNVTNLVDYMLQSHFVSDSDCPSSAKCFINQENNIMAFRNRVDGEGAEDGFLYTRHDAEWAFGFTERFASTSRSAQLDVTDLGRDFTTFCPARFHWRLCDNAEYRMVVADRFYKHCLRAGGALTFPMNEARFRARMAEIDEAIVAEVARWGAVPSTHANRTTWLNDCEHYGIEFLRQRPTYHLAHYRARGWYPSVDAPTAIDAANETVADGTEFTENARLYFQQASTGTIYYTADGSDPRQEGGRVNASAQKYSGIGLVVPPGETHYKARLQAANGEWSALEEVTVKGTDPRAEAVRRSLRVYEVMSSTREEGGDGAEFIVFTNLNASAALDLTGVRLTCAKAGKEPSLDLTLPEGSMIAAGGILTLARADWWPTAKITNGRVEMAVFAGTGTLVQTLTVDANWWDKACDGTGAFFVARDFSSTVTDESQWRASYVAPVDEVAAQAVADLASSTDARREWLVALGATPAGTEAIATFVLDAAQLNACYLLNVPPTNETLQLWIPAFGFDANGKGLFIDGALSIGGTLTPCTLNGRLKLIGRNSLQGPVVEEVELGKVLPLPVERRRIQQPVEPARFFRLRVDQQEE